jgi:hypothetical protein
MVSFFLFSPQREVRRATCGQIGHGANVTVAWPRSRPTIVYSVDQDFHSVALHLCRVVEMAGDYACTFLLHYVGGAAIN